MAKKSPVVEVIIRAKDLASKVVTGFQKNLAAIKKTAKDVALAIGGIAAAAGAYALSLGVLARRGTEVLGVSAAFQKLAGNQERALIGLRKAAQGLVSDYDIMVQFNRAVALGAVATSQEFERLMSVAIKLGKAQGVNAAQAVNDLTLGLGRQSRVILDNLGIMVSAEEAYEAYAKANGTVAEALDEVQKREAFRVLALARAEEMTARMGEATASAGDRVLQMGVALQNFRDQLAKMVAESESVNRFFGGIANIGTDIVRALNGDAETIKSAFQAIGGMAGNAFAVAFLTPVAAMLRRIDRNIMETMPSFLRQSWHTAFGAGASALDNLIEESRGNVGAYRESLAAAGRAGSASAASRGARGVGVVPGGAGAGGSGEGGSTFRGRAMGGTLVELRALREAILKADQALKDARLAEGLARPGAEAQKAAEKVRALAAEIAHLEALAARYGGRPGLAVATAEKPTLPPLIPRVADPNSKASRELGARAARDMQYRAAGRQLAGMEGDELAAAEEDFRRTAGVVAGTMADISASIIRGTGQIEASVISMVGNLLERFTRDPLTGSIIGGAFAIVGALFSRKDRPRVVVDDYSSTAERKMRAAAYQRPVVINNVVESGGRPISEIEAELYDRQERDEVVRFPRGGGLGR